MALYHVLHGTISPLHGMGPEQLRISNLMTRVEDGGVDEVILATNPTVEGEATAVYLSGQLRRAGTKSHAHRHRHSGGQRHRIRRRNHHAKVDGRSAGAVAIREARKLREQPMQNFSLLSARPAFRIRA